MGWHGLQGGMDIYANGPDGGVGKHFGPRYDPLQAASYVRAEPGWYVAMIGRTPGDFARLETLPGAAIKGAITGQTWLVPQLLKITPEARFLVAVPQVFTLAGWMPPLALRSILERLRGLLSLTTAGDVPARIEDDTEATQLAVDILAINYAISIAELAVAEWLTTTMVKDIVTVSSGAHDALQALAAADYGKEA
jgi:hypothetical protein